MAVTTSIRSPADVANLAFRKMGLRMRVGSLLDGSDAAMTMLDVYGATRDQMLEEFDYDFAERTATLALLKSAPTAGYFPPNLWNPATNPPSGFLYEYGFPSDAIKIRALKYTPGFAINYDPRPTKFTEYNDNAYTPAQRTILSNVPAAIAVYTGRVTDPQTWSAKFSEALASRLAVTLGPDLVGLESEKITTGEMTADTAQATTEAR